MSFVIVFLASYKTDNFCIIFYCNLYLIKPESRSYDFNEIIYDHIMKKPLKSKDFESKINSVVNTSGGFSKNAVFLLADLSDLHFCMAFE